MYTLMPLVCAPRRCRSNWDLTNRHWNFGAVGAWLAETTHEDGCIAEVARASTLYRGRASSRSAAVTPRSASRSPPVGRDRRGSSSEPIRRRQPVEHCIASLSDADAATAFDTPIAAPRQTDAHEADSDASTAHRELFVSCRWIRRTLSVDTCDCDD